MTFLYSCGGKQTQVYLCMDPFHLARHRAQVNKSLSFPLSVTQETGIEFHEIR